MVNGISNIEVRHANRQNILQIIRENGMLTKKEISNRLDLSLATVTSLVRELIDEGVVEAGEVSDSTGGRKPVMYQAVANARVSLGISLGHHHIRLVLATWNQEILKTASEWLPYENTDAYWEKLSAIVRDFLEVEYAEDGGFKGIGICTEAVVVPAAAIRPGTAGVPGMAAAPAAATVSGTTMAPTATGEVIPSGIFAGLDPSRVQALFPCPVLFYENMKAAAFSQIGAPGHRRRTVYLCLDRRVGGAVVADGGFWCLSKRAGAFGEMLIGDGGAARAHGDGGASAGGHGAGGSISGALRGGGSLQDCCSSDVIREQSGFELADFFERLEMQDEGCVNIWNTYIRNLARAIHNLRVIFDIDITLGGEMAPYICQRKEPLEEMLAQMALYGEAVDYLRFSDGGAMDGASGAAFLTLERV